MKTFFAIFIASTHIGCSAITWDIHRLNNGVGSNVPVAAANSSLFGLDGSGNLALVPNSTFATADQISDLATKSLENIYSGINIFNGNVFLNGATTTSGVVTFGAGTTFGAYGTGVAALHRTALGLDAVYAKLSGGNSISGTQDFADDVNLAGLLTANGSTVLGDTTSDTITFTGRVASSVLPSVTNTDDLGSTALRFKNLWLAGNAAINGDTSVNSATIGAGTGQTISINAKTVNSLVPSVTASDDLGSSSLKYRNLYLSGTANTGGMTVGTGGTAVSKIRHGISGAMTAGTVTVTDTGATANTRYFFTTHTLGTITLPAVYYASTRTVSTSFVITSSMVTDTSTVDWLAVEP